MAIRLIKPTTSAQRLSSYQDFSSLSKVKPLKKLIKILKKHSGRDAAGRVSIRHQGGRQKRKYRLIGSLQDRLGQEAEIITIEYDPNRSAFIMLVKFSDGQPIYLLAPDGIKVGQKILAQEKTEIIIGSRMQLKNIPTGQPIYDLEIVPGSKGKMVRSAGSSATVIAKEGGYAHIRLPSSEIRKVLLVCYASLGSVSNPSHKDIRLGKAGRKRRMGIRPTVRGKAMHPAAHPHGGGEGNNPIGLKHPKTPWGKPALGYRTRRKRYSDRFILRRRK